MITARTKGRVSALLLGLGLSAATALQAQGTLNKYGNPLTHPPKPTTAAITAEELRTRLYIFADDSMQGRQVATVGNMKGTAYIASELKRLGVEPGGDNGGFFQRLPYVHRMFSDKSTLSVNGSTLALGGDFEPVPGAAAPRPIAGVVAIYGGIDGDTTRQITPAEAAGKFVVMSPGAPGQGGGRGNVPAGFTAGPPVPAPQGCPTPTFGGPAGGRGGRGGAAIGPVSAATLARFPDAVAIALVDLDAVDVARRDTLSNPLHATAVGGGGRGGRGGGADPAAMAVAAVPTPNPAFKAIAGDMVVTNGNQIAIVRNGELVSGKLPAGWTTATVKAKADSMQKKSADSTALAVERRDTVVATARRLLAAGSYSGNATFRGTAVRLDSLQVVTLACAPAAGGRGGAGGGRGAAGGGRNGGGGAGAAPTVPPLTLHLTNAAATKIFGNRADGLQAGAVGGAVTANLNFIEEPSDWARNVVGIVRGSDPALAGEYVAIGAHNDHNGLRLGAHVDHDSLKAFNDENLRLQMQVVKGDLRAITPAQRAAIHVNMDSIRKLHPVARIDSVQNGADDDGSGSMGVLEIAEAVAKMPVKPKRSIIFIWHTGEEAGLLGSNYWTANPTVPVDSVVAQINIDMIGRGRAEDMVGGGPTYLGAVGSRRLSMDLNRQMLAVNAAEPPAKKLRIDYRFDDATLGTSVDGKPASWPGYNNIYGRSDHANYANKCIPIVFFFTGLHGDYHQNTDEPQYIDYPHYSLIDNYIKDLLVDVANKPTRPALNNVCTRR